MNESLPGIRRPCSVTPVRWRRTRSSSCRPRGRSPRLGPGTSDSWSAGRTWFWMSLPAAGHDSSWIHRRRRAERRGPLRPGSIPWVSDGASSGLSGASRWSVRRSAVFGSLRRGDPEMIAGLGDCGRQVVEGGRFSGRKRTVAVRDAWSTRAATTPGTRESSRSMVTIQPSQRMPSTTRAAPQRSDEGAADGGGLFGSRRRSVRSRRVSWPARGGLRSLLRRSDRSGPRSRR